MSLFVNERIQDLAKEREKVARGEAPTRRDVTAQLDALVRRDLLTRSKTTAAALPDPVNDDIFTEKYGNPGYDYAPRTVYFYYIAVNNNGTLRVSHYEYHEDNPDYQYGQDDPKLQWKEIPRNKPGLEEICRKLALNARANGTNPPESGVNFKRVRWSRVSYIMAFFDEPHWNLYRKPNDGSGVVFLTKKKSLDYIPNHSFYDALDLEVPFSPTDVRSAIAFINHLKKDNLGTTLGDGGIIETQDFQFNLFLRVNYADGTSSPMDLILDPGGTNQGPPEIP